jgi:hypothetical protein
MRRRGSNASGATRGPCLIARFHSRPLHARRGAGARAPACSARSPQGAGGSRATRSIRRRGRRRGPVQASRLRRAGCCVPPDWSQTVRATARSSENPIFCVPQRRTDPKSRPASSRPAREAVRRGCRRTACWPERRTAGSPTAPLRSLAASGSAGCACPRPAGRPAPAVPARGSARLPPAQALYARPVIAPQTTSERSRG